MMRRIVFEGREIVFELERKNVKNINLRVHGDGSVYVSANRSVSAGRVDGFVLSKAAVILSTQERLTEAARRRLEHTQYADGESLWIFGRELRLTVLRSVRDAVHIDGDAVLIEMKNVTDAARKKLLKRFIVEQCTDRFGEIIAAVYPLFKGYGVAYPTLRVRDMKTRWGSCLLSKGVITLNTRLLATPRSCVEYVVMHEFCHFIHPNHSERFYELLTVMMPDWEERKKALNLTPECG